MLFELQVWCHCDADYGKVRYKFFMEAGWGPDLRVFPEFTERVWKGMIKINSKKYLAQSFFDSDDFEVVYDSDFSNPKCTTK